MFKAKSQTEQEDEMGNLQNLFALWRFTFTVIRQIVFPGTTTWCWNTKKELRVNSNKINQKQKMDLAEEPGGGGQRLWVSCLISCTYEQKKEGESRDL